MKPFSHLADLAPTKPQFQAAKPTLAQTWVKANGKLERRWTEKR